MKIQVGGKFSHDVSDSAHHFLDKLRAFLTTPEINSALSDVRSGVENFLYIPVILSPDLLIENKNYRSHSKKYDSEIVNFEIDYECWTTSNDVQKWNLLVSGLKVSILATNITTLGNAEKDSIISCLELANNSV